MDGNDRRGRLAITRKWGQAFWIGGVRVKVAGMDRNQVKLVIEADKKVLIMREELLEQTQREQAPREQDAPAAHE